MSDVSDKDFFAEGERELNADILKAMFKPTRMNETTRICEFCGKEFVPTSRIQKYCCKAHRKSEVGRCSN